MSNRRKRSRKNKQVFIPQKLNEEGRTFDFEIAINPVCFTSEYAIIPIHPYFLAERIHEVASNYSRWKINSLTLEWESNLSTSDGGLLIITERDNCLPIYGLPPYEAIIENNTVNSTAWKGYSHKVKCYDEFLPMIPSTKSDIPKVVWFFVYGSGTLSTFGRIIAKVNITLTGLKGNFKLNHVVAIEPAEYALTSGGVTLTGPLANYTKPRFGIVTLSHISTIGSGQFMTCSPMTTLNLNWNAQLSINDRLYDRSADGTINTISCVNDNH